MRDWNTEQKLLNSIELHNELNKLYVLICKLFLVAIRGGIRMVVENPYTQPHYLTMFFPVEPRVIIKDRSEEGDYYTKPTQFFFMNCEPEQNIVLTPLEMIEKVRHINPSNLKSSGSTQVKRSLMHPQFVERFIKTYILDNPNGYWI